MDPKLEMTREWIMLSGDDLRLARFIRDGDDPVYWAAALEKAKKIDPCLRRNGK